MKNSLKKHNLVVKLKNKDDKLIMKHFSFLNKLAVAILLLLIFTNDLYSQENTIKGVVKDEFESPLENVSVKINDDDTEVFTDANGFYNITAPGKSKLVFTYEGFKTKKVSTKGRDIINISLKYNGKNNNEKEVNTGYGKIKQSESTISVSSVDENLIEQENNLDMATFLRTVPGVRVVEEGGELNILIRGNRSLMANDAPLIMLNGSQYNGSLKNLNPRDIKSIDVLKDASATASYGSRGANGVILISTK